MGYRSLRQCVEDLRRTDRLVCLDVEVDANLEAAEIHRRVYLSGGPAVLLTNVKDCPFPMVSNLFGTLDRARFMFRDTLEAVRRLIELKVDANRFWKRPTRYLGAPWNALSMLPKRTGRGAVDDHSISIRQLPHLICWPDDGGAFVTLPQVYTEDADRPGMRNSNLGMYRIQISGGRYDPDREVGLHYQIHRGIGVHHAAAIRRGESLKVNVFVGGSPAMTLAAVMPLPEGLSELTFAGALAGHRIPMITRPGELPVYAEADFCLRGHVEPGRLLPEGPFGDHLGYYSLAHEFPVLRVRAVTHRTDAIWPFTVVGRPPQEDTTFGQLIHELTGPVIPTVIPGVHAVHAVDAAGVHPLLLAIGSERYTPYGEQPSRPQELLTQASAILGQGQMSLAKYLLIVDRQDDPELDIHRIENFWTHWLRRVDWTRDLHFHTRTTIDTLDYSGDALNQGSKVVVAAAGPPRRELPTDVSPIGNLPDGYSDPRCCLPGTLAIRAPRWTRGETTGSPASIAATAADPRLRRFCMAAENVEGLSEFPLIVLVDDSDFTSRNLNNFLWTVFTRSNPATDIDGLGAFSVDKHWGCRGSLVIDARIKSHHAPPLIEDPEVTKKVDALAASGGPLSTYL